MIMMMPIDYDDANFTIGSVLLLNSNNGVTNFSTSTLPIGNHTIMISYDGDNNFEKASLKVNQVVSKGKSDDSALGFLSSFTTVEIGGLAIGIFFLLAICFLAYRYKCCQCCPKRCPVCPCCRKRGRNRRKSRRSGTGEVELRQLKEDELLDSSGSMGSGSGMYLGSSSPGGRYLPAGNSPTSSTRESQPYARDPDIPRLEKVTEELRHGDEIPHLEKVTVDLRHTEDDLMEASGHHSGSPSRLSTSLASPSRHSNSDLTSPGGRKENLFG